MEANKGFERAFALMNGGQLHASEIAFVGLLEAGFDPAQCLYGLGLIRRRAGDSAMASEYFAGALRANPRHADAEFCLGAIAESRRLLNVALDHYRAARDIDADHAAAASALIRIDETGVAAASPEPLAKAPAHAHCAPRSLPPKWAFVLLTVSLPIIALGAALAVSPWTLVRAGIDSTALVFGLIGMAAIAGGIRLFIWSASDLLARRMPC